MPRTAVVWPEFDAHVALADPITITFSPNFLTISGTKGSSDAKVGSVTLTTTTPTVAVVGAPERAGAVNVYASTPTLSVSGTKEYTARSGSVTLTATSPTVSVVGRKKVANGTAQCAAKASVTFGSGVKKSTGPVSITFSPTLTVPAGRKKGITPSSNTARLLAIATGSLQPVIEGAISGTLTTTGSLAGTKKARLTVRNWALDASFTAPGIHLGVGSFNPTMVPGGFGPGSKTAVNSVENKVTLYAYMNGRLHEITLPPTVYRPRIRVLDAPLVYNPDPDLDANTPPPEVLTSPF